MNRVHVPLDKARANRRWVANRNGRLYVMQLGHDPRPLSWVERLAWFWLQRVPRV